MRTYVLAFLAAIMAATALSGCGKIDGPRFWWDDRNQTRLPESYQLPADPGAPPESGEQRANSPSGSDLTSDDLKDYRTDLDVVEEKRKSEASLVDF